MVSDKPAIQRLVAICHKMGLNQVIISPGSRNAPLIISFIGHGGFTCRTITDERVAGFIGLGLGLELQRPAILICTSGTAVLNYAPAIAEAYYQKIPLLVLTADRPSDRIDQGIGQTIRQFRVYANYIKASYQLSDEAMTIEELQHDDAIIIEAIHESMNIDPGPVHINIPLNEPLYGQVPLPRTPEFSIRHKNRQVDSIQDFNSLQDIWWSCKKKIAIIGQINDIEEARSLFNCLKARVDIVILSESVSNLRGRLSIRNIDRVIDSIPKDALSDFYPELIISFGGAVVSKKIKVFLEQANAHHHWHIEQTNVFCDTYKCLTHRLPVSPKIVLDNLKSDMPNKVTEEFVDTWSQLNVLITRNHNDFMADCQWSDLFVFDRLIKFIPNQGILHLANSTPIRYIQLFDYPPEVTYRSNRGVGGIDGCLSTALGCALADERNHILITGDLAFIYDSNALWYNDHPKNLKIIVINNGGGGIFRIIPGPDKTAYLEDDFEAHHIVKIQSLAEAFNVNYLKIENEHELEIQLLSFILNDGFGLMEIVTPREINDVILKNYFNYIRVPLNTPV